MKTRHSFRSILAVLFGVILLGCSFWGIRREMKPDPDLNSDLYRYNYIYTFVTDVADDGLVTAGDLYTFYGDGFREGDWVHMYAEGNNIVRVSRTYEELTNRT